MTGWQGLSSGDKPKGDNHNGNVRPFPTTADRADELLRARTRQVLPVPPVPPPAVSTPVASPGYPVPPRRRRPVDPRPSARQLACRDWFLTGLVLGAFAGAALTMVILWTVQLFT